MKLPAHVAKFGACTADLEALADWLTACGVTTVAMESTGVLLDPAVRVAGARGFDVYLVDPRQTQARAGPAEERRAGLPVDSAAAQLRPVDGVVSAGGRSGACCVASCGSGRC